MRMRSTFFDLLRSSVYLLLLAMIGASVEMRLRARLDTSEGVFVDIE
jgi:hypothetical protein